MTALIRGSAKALVRGEHAPERCAKVAREGMAATITRPALLGSPPIASRAATKTLAELRPDSETVTDSDFWDAVGEIKAYVEKNCSGYSARGAKSFSGSEHNEWSILVEPYGGSRKLNFHIRVSG